MSLLFLSHSNQSKSNGKVFDKHRKSYLTCFPRCRTVLKSKLLSLFLDNKERTDDVVMWLRSLIGRGLSVSPVLLCSFQTNFSITLHQCLLCTCSRVFLKLLWVLAFIFICKLPHCSNTSLTASLGRMGNIITEGFLKSPKYYGIGFDKPFCCDFMMWILKNYLSWN